MENALNFLDQLNRIRRRYRKWLFYALAVTVLYNLHHVLLDMALSLLHWLFEWLEYFLEELIQHLFDTTRQQSQAIVFYLLFTFSAFFCYRVGLKLLKLIPRLPGMALDHCLFCKLRLADFWQQQSALVKAKWILSGSTGLLMAAVWALS